ncbi:MAG: methylmalonyl-CoA epimerase [Anaerolineae bacterium]|nr:methylmalonyl-CoA epimerase [Anaerolineae bacterium]
MTVKAVNHIAIVTEDLAAALRFWRDALGLPLDHTAEVAAEEVKVAVLPAGASAVELLEPAAAGSGVARYLAKRGPGLHHICLEVEDIEATLARLAAHGVQLIDETPRTGDDGKRYAFVHPKSAGGVLVELYQLPR